jgi:hypothetical protein
MGPAPQPASSSGAVRLAPWAVEPPFGDRSDAIPAGRVYGHGSRASGVSGGVVISSTPDTPDISIEASRARSAGDLPSSASARLDRRHPAGTECLPGRYGPAALTRRPAFRGVSIADACDGGPAPPSLSGQPYAPGGGGHISGVPRARSSALPPKGRGSGLDSPPARPSSVRQVPGPQRGPGGGTPHRSGPTALTCRGSELLRMDYSSDCHCRPSPRYSHRARAPDFRSRRGRS